VKVLVACEFSGRVRDAFIERGHEAMSCDLKPTSVSGPHYQGDVFDIIADGWDLMIAFPPCTYLTVSGNRWMNHPDHPERPSLRLAAMQFFYDLYTCVISRVCIENPKGIMSTRFRKPDQFIEPWMFGHKEQKQTALWLKNLPKLKPTRVVSLPDDPKHKQRVWLLGPSKHRSEERSLTYSGVAQAMADQWGAL
jgi:hypothetical protein